jgi:transcriptional regulator with XRE-family HTH domain
MMLSGVTMCHMSTRNGLDVAALGRRLLARREALHLDQEAVAKRACVSRAYISRLERGVVPAPKVTELEQVATALGLTLVELIRQPPGTRTERYSAVCSDLVAQLEGKPPAVADAILQAWKITAEIADIRDQGQNN